MKHRWGNLYNERITREIFIVFVGILEIFFLVRIGAEANAQTVQDEVLLSERDLVVLILTGHCLLCFYLIRF